jgi:hypothetical protein
MRRIIADSLSVWKLEYLECYCFSCSVSHAWPVEPRSPRLVSPTHKRTEGRAPVGGSEFTSKDAALQGGSSRNCCYAERKIARSDCAVTGGGGWWHLTPFSRSILYTEIKSRRGAGHSRVIRGCWFVLLYFVPYRPLPRPRRPLLPPLPRPAA